MGCKVTLPVDVGEPRHHGGGEVQLQQLLFVTVGSLLQLVVRVGAHRPVQELHLAATGGQLVDQQHLVDVVAGQPVRRGYQHQVQLGQRRVIAEPVQPRPADTGAAIAVITVDVLVIQVPAALRGRRRSRSSCRSMPCAWA